MGHLTMEALAVLLSGNSGNAGTGNIICFGFEVRLKNILHARQTFVQSAKNCMHSMESNKDVTQHNLKQTSNQLSETYEP